MTQEQKRQLREAIEKRITENEQAILDLKEANKPMVLNGSIGRISRMDYINNKAVNESELHKVWRVRAMWARDEPQLTCAVAGQYAGYPLAWQVTVQVDLSPSLFNTSVLMKDF